MKNFNHIKTVKRGWTKQPNAVLHDNSLTSDAKVVLYELLSISGNFHISELGIASSVNISLERVKKAVKLLKANGYIEVSKVITNSRLNGYNWTIADTNGALRKCDFRETENPTTENQSLEIPSDGISDGRDFSRSESRQTENPSIYEYTERYEEQNNERRIDEQTELDKRLHHQEQAVVADATTPSAINSPSFTADSDKNSNQPEVITQREYMYQQFLKKYPKKPTGTDAAATKQAFFDIPDLENIFDTIMAGVDEWCNSVDWNKEGGRYITKPLNFITTQKWEEIPRVINTEIDPGLVRFMRGDLEDYL